MLYITSSLLRYSKVFLLSFPEWQEYKDVWENGVQGAKWLYSVGRQRASGTAMLQDLGISVGVFSLISQLLLVSISVKWAYNSYRTLTFQFVPYNFPMDNTKYSTICEKYVYIQYKLESVLCNTGFMLYNCTVLTALPQGRS